MVPIAVEEPGCRAALGMRRGVGDPPTRRYRRADLARVDAAYQSGTRHDIVEELLLRAKVIAKAEARA
jgi:hypothetical protein